MSPKILAATSDLRNFLFENVYQTPCVHREFIKAMKIIRDLYHYFMEEDVRLPCGGIWEASTAYGVETARPRKVCDFIAGMTDRYALDLYTNIFFPKRWSVQ
jgi:dGTPase